MEDKDINGINDITDDFDDDDFADWLPGGQFTDMSKKSSLKKVVIDRKHGTVTSSESISNDDFDDIDDDFEFDDSEPIHTPDESDFSLFEEYEEEPVKVKPVQKQKTYSKVKVHEKRTDYDDSDDYSVPKKKFKVKFTEDDDFDSYSNFPPAKKTKSPIFSGVFDTVYEAPKKRKKVTSKKFILRVVALILIISLVGFFGSASVMLKGVKHQDVKHDWADTVASKAPDLQLADYGEYYNVLLIGADASLGTTARSDTMIIVSLDRMKRTIKLASLLRDNYVEIPGHGSNRLNAAFAFGGAPLLMQTIEANFRIKIDKFISVDFDSLEAIVDSIGGVDMEITDAEAKYINRYSERGTKTLTGGVRHLNGNEALHYARIRKLDNDFGRTNRQRKLIDQLVKTCKGLGAFKLFSVVKTASSYLTTNMSNNEIMWFGIQGLICSGKEMEQTSIPVEGGYKSQTVNGMAVLVPDLEKNCNELHNFLFGTTPDPILE